MKNLSTLQNMPWVCLGDFNEVPRPDEHEGVGQRSNAQIKAFLDAVDACMLLDHSYLRPFWTFEKKVTVGSFTRVRLDRALIIADLQARFSPVDLFHLTVATSDHNPIFVNLNREQMHNQRARTFRYEVMWDTHPDLKTAVQAGWDLNSHNPRVCVVRANLEALGRNLGAWSKSMFGSVKGEIRTLKEWDHLRNDAARQGLSHA